MNQLDLFTVVAFDALLPAEVASAPPKIPTVYTVTPLFLAFFASFIASSATVPSYPDQPGCPSVNTTITLFLFSPSGMGLALRMPLAISTPKSISVPPFASKAFIEADTLD